MKTNYLEYGKCISCKYWHRWEHKEAFGKCTEGSSKNFTNVDFYDETNSNYTVTSEPLITGKRFGCIHWGISDDR